MKSLEHYDNDIVKKNEKYIPFLESLCTVKSPSYDTLRDIIRFWMTYSESELLVRDFQQPGNWGIKLKGKNEKLVLIDHGASMEVIEQYYS